MNADIFFKERSLFFTKTSSESNRAVEDASNATESEGKVKTKLLSMWNNMKYGMKLKTSFSKESPLWLLGKCYRSLDNTTNITELGADVAAFQSQSEITNNDDESFEEFKKDFITRLWLTYRREFPILNGSSYSSDCGWGCMLRSGQMLLAQALVCHFLGRAWRWNPNLRPVTRDNYVELVNHRKILKWFGDKPSKNSPLSIHALVTLGQVLGKKAGDWYAPGFVAHLLKQAVNLASKENYEFDSINVNVAQDCAVYIEDIMTGCEGEDKIWKKALILLVPVHLGVEKFNSVYAPYLTALFSLKQCLGIIGGRPKHSLYFVGFQDDKLIYLDPHYCQEVVDVWAPDFPLTSFHCRSPRKMHISKIDPSCCLGFYCTTKEEFFNLVETIQGLVIPPGKSSGMHTEYPLFVFCDGFSKDARTTPKRLPPQDLEYSGSSTDIDDIESEGFEII